MRRKTDRTGRQTALPVRFYRFTAHMTEERNIMKTTYTTQAARLPQAFETEISSAGTGRIYRIQTAAIGEMPPEGYPVLFVLDGEAFFPALFNIMQSLMNNPVTRSRAPCLIVGIGYVGGGVRDLAQRAADYTPPLRSNASEDEQRQFGQADRFAAFIDSELTAFLESKYRLDKNETAVFGHSFGALFGLYSLLPTAVSDGIGSYPPRFGGTTGGYSTLCRLKPAKRHRCLPQHRRARTGQRLQTQGRTRHGRTVRTYGGRVRQARGRRIFREYPNANHGNVPFHSLTDCVEYLRKAWQR